MELLASSKIIQTSLVTYLFYRISLYYKVFCWFVFMRETTVFLPKEKKTCFVMIYIAAISFFFVSLP